MGSFAAADKPHAVCIPYPAQGHITPMLKLAKLLHASGFHITFVNTEFNHNRLLKSRGPSALAGLHDFHFKSIPDGLPPSDDDCTQDIPALCESTSKTCLIPFLELLKNIDDPPVTCIVSDGVMSFTLDAAKELGVPEVLFWTTSACGFMGYLHYQQLIDRGLAPLKDAADLSNEYLNTKIEWVPGMNNMRLADFPSFIRTIDPNDIMLNFVNREAQRAINASAVILNTFDALEHRVLEAMRQILPNLHTVGPLSFLARHTPPSPLATMSPNLWKEDPRCLRWLETKAPRSVVYVNFGSITVMTKKQLVEFAWGLANSNQTFLWIIRPDLVRGDAAVLPEKFLECTRERGMLANWCDQEKVLAHQAIGGFLTHSGWNSTLESLSSGVSMLCWPFFAEQQTNCRYACGEWGTGMEVDSAVKREEVERQVRELMEGEKGKEMRRKAMEWKDEAIKATEPGGTSFVSFQVLVQEVLLGR